MRARTLALMVVTAMCTVGIAACAPPPKQAEVADDTRETGMEQSQAETATMPTEGPPAKEAAEMRTKCCAECKIGMDKDRSGSDPKTVPCADYTDTLSPWCLEFFRGTPTMAASCAQ